MASVWPIKPRAFGNWKPRRCATHWPKLMLVAINI